MLGGAYVLHPPIMFWLARDILTGYLCLCMPAWSECNFFKYFFNLLLMGGPNDKRGDAPVDMGRVGLVIGGVV